MRQFFQFALVGVANTAVDFGVYVLLTRSVMWFQVNYLIANALAFFLAISNSYILNRHWTFKNSPKQNFFSSYVKFNLVCLFTLMVIELTLYLLVERAGVYDLFAKVLIVLESQIFNFFLSKYLVFKD